MPNKRFFKVLYGITIYFSSLLFFSEPVLIKRGNVGKPNIRGGLSGGVYGQACISQYMNNFLKEFNISKNCFSLKFEAAKCFGDLCGQAKRMLIQDFTLPLRTIINPIILFRFRNHQEIGNLFKYV